MNEDVKEEEEAALDLADLDLSRLRLTKKDLETLSSITPGLPKCFQEQLLAKLPPTQARKLSRTLSMQNNAPTASVKIYKRSHSGGRELDNNKTVNDNKILVSDSTKEKESLPKQSDSSREESSDRSSILYRKSTSRGRCDYDTDTKSRSTSVCKNSDEYTKSLCSSYSSDVSDKYKYYSPYVTKKNEKSDLDCAALSCKIYENSQRNSCVSPTKEAYGRPPSGCLSPPPCTPDNSLRRRSSQRRVSRFLRPDFFDQPREESAYLREKKQRERETQSVLREIREKSRERSRDRRSENWGTVEQKRDGYLNQNVNEPVVNLRHVRNKSLERFCDSTDVEKEVPQVRRRSLSRPRELSSDKTEFMSKNEIADKILQELQILSAAKSKRDQTDNELNLETKDNSSKFKMKSKEKVDANEPPADNAKTSSSVVNKKVVKVKKAKKTEAKDIENSNILKNSNLEVVKIIESEKPKKESKLMRPKSYPSKEPDKQLALAVSPTNDLSQEKDEAVNKSNVSEQRDFKIIRPKSFPNSKLTPPKEVKKSTRSSAAISSVVDKFMDKVEKPNPVKTTNSKLNIVDLKSNTSKSSESSSTEVKASVKKVTKVAKKTKLEKTDQKSSEKIENERSSSNIPQPKEKSPEKKTGKGLLYAIGQKFEKLRENAKNRDKKSTVGTENTLQEKEKAVASNGLDKVEGTKSVLKKKKSKQITNETSAEERQDEKSAKADKKSRIDSMIKSLRERSITRAPIMTESGLIKRAVSVEDMSGVFNKTGVNKVLGLFKKIEKDSSDRKVMNTRSTSNIERQIEDSIMHKDRPKSSGFVNTFRKCPPVTNKEKSPAQNSSSLQYKKEPKCVTTAIPPAVQNKCPDCGEEKDLIASTKSNTELKKPTTESELSRDKRKELTLDFSKLDNSYTKQRNYFNGHNNYSDLSYGNYNNNNNFHIGLHEINRNLLTPSNENIANYSSDSRSPHDDCASSSTFLSPSDEPELCFDNWSVCSEDNFISTPSPTVSRLSRASQLSSPNTLDSQPESVIDRIKRKSFYCRFNENKPKRNSSIVGPAAREYYRESAAKLRSRPPDRVTSPDIEPIRSSHEYFKPLKLSTAANDLKPPHYKNSIDYSKPRKSLNDIYPPPSSTKRYLDPDYSRSKNGALESGSSYYSTYNPKRRSSFTLNGVVPGSTSNIEGYATLGRRLRPYDHRSFSTLDTAQGTNTSPTVGSLRRDPRTPTDFGNLPRTNLQFRNSSMTRSPTNI